MFGKGKKKDSDEALETAVAPIQGADVTMKPTDKNNTHTPGKEFQCSERVASIMEKNGTAVRVAMLLVLFVASFAVRAQNFIGRELRFKNPLHGVIASDAADLIDTVTNAGTSFISTITKSNGSANETTIQVNATKISGTVAGTISILGSIDNVNFKAIPTAETQTGVATATATDVASQTFVWRLNGSPFTYYRISWTGSGTMSASFNGYLMSH